VRLRVSYILAGSCARDGDPHVLHPRPPNHFQLSGLLGGDIKRLISESVCSFELYLGLRHVSKSRGQDISSFIHQWLYSPLLGRGRISSFVMLYTVGSIPWMGDLPVARPLLTQQQKHNNPHRHPCLELDSNPRHQCSSGRSQFMP
jgi:hypothetical protein